MSNFYTSLQNLSHRLRESAKDFLRHRQMKQFLATFTEDTLRANSYYPNAPHKSFKTVKEELKKIYITRKDGPTPQVTYASYMMFGLDRAGVSYDDYLFYNEFNALRDRHKPGFAKMLNHKIYTLVYLQARGISVSHILGQVDTKGIFCSLDGRIKEDFYTWLDKQPAPVFCKLPDGFQGTSCFVLEKKGDAYFKSDKPLSREELDKLLPYLQIEEVIQQHPDMAAIYPHAVNTCRIVTVCKRGGEPQFFSGYSLFGMGGTRVSNGCSGGILVGFDASGHLVEAGMRELSWGGGMYAKHPDTGVAFKDCTIPYFNEVLELACAAHRTLNDIRSIAWDIAITPTGPVIIEGNQGWATTEHQFFNGGMRQKAYEMLG